MADRFCHLHVHSEYSLLDGIIRIPRLAEYCKKTGMDAVALTDHGVMYGAIEFLEACRREGIKPIIGCEVYVAQDSRHTKSGEDRSQQSHLLLLVQNETGYRNLSTLVSMAYREGLYYKPRVDHELLSRYSDGIIALSGCFRGEVSRCMLSTDPDKGRKVAEFYRDIFPGRFYIELQEHGLPDQHRLNKKLVELASTLCLPVVASNDCHFITPDERYLQDVMICIQVNKKLTDTDRFAAYTQNHYVKTPQEMAKLFDWIPEAIANTGKIADLIEYNPSLDAFHFPEFKPPDGSSPQDYLKRKSREGLAKRIEGKVPEGYASRLEYELGVISDMGFASYFLIVADFVGWTKNRGIPVGPGRGSAAGCLVSYSLGITDLDPIQYNLQFERFLNPARKSMPDIDMDFEPSGRAEVIDYVVKTYGEEHVCQIVTFNRLKARAAIRDVGRVMDIPLSEVDKVAKLVPWGKNLEDAIKDPEFQKAYEASDVTRNWIDTAKRVEGYTRNASIDAAGVVICADPIWHHAPVQVMENETMSVCMYSMTDAEKVGLVKMDFLGLRTLTYLREACNNIKATRGIDIDLLKIPLDDQPTFKMLGQGDVIGVFQLEGGGMRDLLMNIAPDRLGDLMACIALFRPGPMEHDLHYAYARRKNGKEPVSYKHPLLEPILSSTFGILTYQEQISSILQALGGIDLGNATLIMKLISKKKDRAAIAKYKADFLKGAASKGIDKKIANEVWEEMEAFAGYGFNLAHTACYGMVAYQTAYLKANFPREFFAAYLSSEMHNQEKIALISDEMRKKGITLYPPDVNKSFAKFTVEGEGVRYGLAAIKSVGTQAVDSIASARDTHGKYQTIYQLASRIDLRLVNKGVLESLVSAGACDNLVGSRKGMLIAIPDALDAGKRKQEDASRGQVALFGSAAADTGPNVSTTDEYPMHELLKMEKDSLGFYLSHHPLDDVWEKLEPSVREKIADLGEMRDGANIRIGGMIGFVNRRLSKKMQNFALFNLEDQTAKIEGIIFPQAYTSFGFLLETDAFVVIKGRLRVDEKESPTPGAEDEDSSPRKDLQIIAEEIWRLDPLTGEFMGKSPSSSRPKTDVSIGDDILLADEDPFGGFASGSSDMVVSVGIDMNKANRADIQAIRKKLETKKGPTPVKLRFRMDGKEVWIEAGRDRGVIYSSELRESLLEIPSVEDVSLIRSQELRQAS